MDNYAQIRENVKDLVYRELDAIANEGQLTVDCVHILYQLVDIIKDLEEAAEKETENMMNMEGYSNRGRMMPRYYDGNSYGSGNYNISGTYNNSNGRYMNSNRGRSGGYSRDDGRQDMISKLENLWNETRDEHDKEAIKRLLDQMR